jgi:hypothetical protein
MDIAIFSGSLCVAVAVGLTMKKHGVFVVPQSLGLLTTNREYFDSMEKEMQQAEVESYFTLHNTTRHLGSNQK